MEGNTAVVTATFIVYIGVMLALGYIAYKRTTNLSDYILGGRSLGPGTAALSAGASWRGSHQRGDGRAAVCGV